MIRRITEKKPLKILGFTDTHLDGNEACTRLTMRLMKEMIETEAPDLVVLVGDIVTGGENRERAERFTDLMTELGIPWCPILGNHEGDNPFSVSRAEMAQIFRKSPFCLLPEKQAVLENGKSVFGITNYSVPVMDESGRICFRLIFLDGGNDMSSEDRERFGFADGKKSYADYLKESQIQWFEQEIRSDSCPNMVFSHIPLPEYRIAMQEGECVFGANRESICCPPVNSGMFEAMCRSGKTAHFVCGHDHVNDSRILYCGIQLIYNRMSGLSSYNAISEKVSDRLLQGATVYFIDANGGVRIEDRFYEEVFELYHDEIYSVIRK